MEQAGNTPDTIDEKDLEGRRDLRDQTIVTIDGADAKDLDDAVTVTKLKTAIINSASTLPTSAIM